MGKLIKTCLVIGVLCVVIGVVTSGAGIFGGGLSQLKTEILNGEWSFDFGKNTGATPFFELEEQHYFKEDVVVNEDKESVKETFSESEVKKLHIRATGVTVEFAEYDGEGIFVEAYMVHKYQAYLERGELHVVARGQNAKNLGQGKVTVNVPSSVYNAGTLELEIESAASVVSFDKMIANDVELEVSAGTISWQELTAGDLSVEMSAGAVNGANTVVTGETDLKVSAGAVTLNGTFGRETEIETAAGKVEIVLTDALEAYNYDVSCAGGKVTIGDQKVEGIAKRFELKNGATKHMDIECSVGTVNIAIVKN